MSSKTPPPLKLKILLNGQAFEAEGPSNIVIEQFHQFLSLTESKGTPTFPAKEKNFSAPEPDFGITPRSPNNRPQQAEHSQNDLRKIVQEDPKTSILFCSISPATPNAGSDTALVLLLAHHILLQQTPVPVLSLSQSLKRSGHSFTRVDRLLREPLKNQWVLKSGVGKGGKYQLTKTGLIKAQDIAQGLTHILP